MIYGGGFRRGKTVPDDVATYRKRIPYEIDRNPRRCDATEKLIKQKKKNNNSKNSNKDCFDRDRRRERVKK